MEFRTIVDPGPFRHKIDYSTTGMSIGSCFAENIAARLKRAKFPITSNPFGVLYNPASIAETIDTLHSGRVFAMDDLVCEGDIWSCFSFHGSFSSTDPQRRALDAMNKAVREGVKALRKADYMILTFGTAWVYELDPDYMKGEEDENLFVRTKRLVRELARPRVVANCHKFPARAFNRRRLAVSEIVNDDLRDYRFYKEDMLHPNDQAVEYIWELFGGAFFAKKTAEALGEVQNIISAAEHRPLNPESASHRRFLRSMLKKAEAFQKKYPAVDLSQEMAYFSS